MLYVPSSHTDTEVDKAWVVSPSQPRIEEGIYWGYTVRLAHTFSSVFTQSPYKDGYDLTIGTSERGTSVDEVALPKFRYVWLNSSLPSDLKMPKSIDSSCQIYFSIETIKLLIKSFTSFPNLSYTYNFLYLIWLLSFNKFHKGKLKMQVQKLAFEKKAMLGCSMSNTI